MLTPSMHTQKGSINANKNKCEFNEPSTKTKNYNSKNNNKQETKCKPTSRLYAQLLIKHQNAVTEFHEKLEQAQNEFSELQRTRFAELKEQLINNHERTRLLLEDKWTSYEVHKELLEHQREFLSVEKAENNNSKKDATECTNDINNNNDHNDDCSVNTSESTLFIDLYHPTIANLHTYHEDNVQELIAEEWQRVLEIQSELVSNYNKRLALIQNTYTSIQTAAAAHKTQTEELIEQFMDILLSINAVDINTIHVLAQQILLQCNQQTYNHATQMEEITETLRQREILLHHTRYMQMWNKIQKLFQLNAWHSEMHFTAYWLQSSVFICSTQNNVLNNICTEKQGSNDKCYEHPEVQYAREVVKFVNEVIVQYEALINGLIMFTNTLNECNSLNNDEEDEWRQTIQTLINAYNKEDKNKGNDVMVSLLQIIRHVFPLCDGATPHGWLRLLHNYHLHSNNNKKKNHKNGINLWEYDNGNSNELITLDTQTSAQLPRQAILEVIDEWRMKALVFIRNTQERSKALLTHGQSREVEQIQKRATAQVTRLASLKEWLYSLSQLKLVQESKEYTNTKESINYHNYSVNNDDNYDNVDTGIMVRIQETIEVIHHRSNAFLHQVSHFVEHVLIEESMNKQLLSQVITAVQTHKPIMDNVKNVETSGKGKKGNIVKAKNITGGNSSSSCSSSYNSNNTISISTQHAKVRNVCGVLVLLERVNILLFSAFSEVESLFISHMNTMIAERNDMMETLHKLEQRYLTLTECTIPNCTSSTEIQVHFKIGLGLLNEMQRMHQDYHASTHRRISVLQQLFTHTINKWVASFKVWIGVEEECETINRIQHELLEHIHESERETNEINEKVKEKIKQRNKDHDHNNSNKGNNKSKKNNKQNEKSNDKSKNSRTVSSHQPPFAESSPSASSSSSSSSSSYESEEEEEEQEEEEQKQQENVANDEKWFHIMSKYKQFTANDNKVYNIIATHIPLSVNDYYEKYFHCDDNVKTKSDLEHKVSELGIQEGTNNANEDEQSNAVHELKKMLIQELEQEQQKEELEKQEWYQSLSQSEKEKLELKFLQHSFVNEEHEQEEEEEEGLQNKSSNNNDHKKKMKNKNNKLKSATSPRNKEENDKMHVESKNGKHNYNNNNNNNVNGNPNSSYRNLIATTTSTLNINSNAQELPPWMISCISNLFVKTNTQNTQLNECEVYVISKWHHSLQVTLLNWVLRLQETLQTHFIPIAMNYLKTMVDEMTSNVLRHHRFRPASLQSNVVEVRQRQLERVIVNEESSVHIMHHNLDEIVSTWHTNLNTEIEKEKEHVTRSSKLLIEHEMYKANSLTHLNTVRHKHSQLMTSAQNNFMKSIREELFQENTLRELSLLQTQCDDLIARETSVSVDISGNEHESGNKDNSSCNNSNSVVVIKVKRKKHEKQQGQQKESKNVVINEDKKEREVEKDESQNELAMSHAKYIRHLHELRDRLIKAKDKITTEYNTVHNNYINHHLEKLHDACQQAYSKHLAEIQFIDHIHELAWKMKRESHKLLVAPTTHREEEIVETITQIEKKVIMNKRIKKLKSKFNPLEYFAHMSTNSGSDDNNKISYAKNKTKDRDNASSVVKVNKLQEKTNRNVKELKTLCLTKPVALSTTNENKEIQKDEDMKLTTCNEPTIRSTHEIKLIEEKLKEHLLQGNVLFEEKLWNESSAVHILHLLDVLRFMLFTQYTWLAMSNATKTMQTYRVEFIALPLRTRPCSSNSGKNTFVNISNTFMTKWHNSIYENYINSCNFKYVIEPLPIAVEQKDEEDEKENANMQEENATTNVNSTGTIRRKSSAKAKRSLVMAKVENELHLANRTNMTRSRSSNSNISGGGNTIKTIKINETVKEIAKEVDEVNNMLKEEELEESTQIIVQDRFSRVRDYVLIDVNNLTSSIFTNEMNDKITKPILEEAIHAIHHFFIKWTETETVSNKKKCNTESVVEVENNNASTETNNEKENDDNNRVSPQLHVPVISRSLHSLVPDKNELNKCHNFTEEEINAQFTEEIAKHESKLATRLKHFQELLWTQLRYLSSTLLPAVPLALMQSLFIMSMTHIEELLQIILKNYFECSQHWHKQLQDSGGGGTTVNKQDELQKENSCLSFDTKESSVLTSLPMISKPEFNMLFDWYWQQALIVLQDAYYMYTLRSYTLAQSFLCLLKSFATCDELNTLHNVMSETENENSNNYLNERVEIRTPAKRGIRYLLSQKIEHVQKKEMTRQEQNQNAAQQTKSKTKVKRINDNQEKEKEDNNNSKSYQAGLLLDQTLSCITRYNKLHPQHTIQSSARKIFDEYFCEEVQFGNNNHTTINSDNNENNKNRENETKQTRRTSLLSASESSESSLKFTIVNANRINTNKIGNISESNNSNNVKEKKNTNNSITTKRQGKRAAAEEEKLLKAQEEQQKMLEMLEQQKLESELNARRHEVLTTTIRQLRTPSFINPSCNAGKKMLKCVHNYADPFYENIEAMGDAINTLFIKCKE